MRITNTEIEISHPIIKNANSIADQHAQYMEQFINRGNTALYQILADIFRVYEQLEACEIKERVIKEMRKYLRESHNIKTQANTKTTALVTKYVTRASRKTAHVYSRVLEVAIANSIGSADLVEFIKLKGGIDKVRMSVASAEALTQHNALIKHYQIQLRNQLAQKTAIGVVDLSAVSHTLPTACDVDFKHLLCRFNHVTNSHEIVGIMYPSSALEIQAMREYLTMLDVACHSDQSSFYERCKEHGLNMDILLRWMGANGIKDASAAKAIARTLQPSANSSTKAAPIALLKAA